MEFLWTAFIVGLAGSFHCVGMCGPIALALPGGFHSNMQLVSSKMLYNIGRVVTYAVLGILFGLFGQIIAFSGLQQYLSIGIGLILLVIAFFSFNLESQFLRVPVITNLTNNLKTALGRLLKTGQFSSLFFIGILNGLLPCGFVYIALLGALAAGSVAEGMFYMVFFGFGTIPLMLATSLFGSFLSIKARHVLKKMTPVFIAVFAVLFIVRGLNLGVPYLSPKINAQAEMSCH